MLPLLTLVISLIGLWPGLVASKVTPFLPQGFMFDWTPEGQSPPVPTTAQCETIHIKWGRGSVPTNGPNPNPPYYLQVYTSSFIIPLIIGAGSGLSYDWPVPFIPGTQYQICMFDAKGTTGGCQAVYTVYQAPNSTLANPPTCANLTYPPPESQLGVNAAVSTGPFSQYGWIDQCTDISVTPTNGTPPYTLTVAPALHPPYNITSNDMSPINWTVSLSWGTPFFISLADSTGMTWASGPLHSGGGGSTDCLATDQAKSSSNKVPVPVAIGSGLGGLFVGLAIGLLSALAFACRRNRPKPDEHPDSAQKSAGMMITSSPAGRYQDLPNEMSRDVLMRDNGYRVDPFVLPTEHGSRPTTGSGPTSTQSTSGANLTRSTTQPLVSPSRTTSVLSSSVHEPPRPPSDRPSTSHVYVVHHDGGRPPISVFTDDGTQVVELPPQYSHQNRPTPSTSPQPLNSPSPPSRRPLPEKPPSRQVAN